MCLLTKFQIVITIFSALAVIRSSHCNHNLTEMALTCHYVRNESQSYPYPYNYSPWFRFLNSGAVRTSPYNDLSSRGCLDAWKVGRSLAETALKREHCLLCIDINLYCKHTKNAIAPGTRALEGF